MEPEFSGDAVIAEQEREGQREGAENADREIEEALDIPSESEVSHAEEERAIARQEAVERGEEPEPTPQESKVSAELAEVRAQAERANQVINQLTQEAWKQHHEKEQKALEEEREYDPQSFYDKKIQRLEEQVQRGEQEKVYQQATAVTVQAEQEYAKANPDYWDTVEAVKEHNRQQLRQQHPNAPAEAIEQQVNANAAAFALRVLQAGHNPAEAAHKFGQQFLAAQQGQAQPAHPPQQVQGMQLGSPPPQKPTMTSLSKVAGRQGSARGRKVTREMLAGADIDSVDGRELYDAVRNNPHLARQIEEHGYGYLS